MVCRLSSLLVHSSVENLNRHEIELTPIDTLSSFDLFGMINTWQRQVFPFLALSFLHFQLFFF